MTETFEPPSTVKITSVEWMICRGQLTTITMPVTLAVATVISDIVLDVYVLAALILKS